jgi:cytochrome c6
MIHFNSLLFLLFLQAWVSESYVAPVLQSRSKTYPLSQREETFTGMMTAKPSLPQLSKNANDIAMIPDRRNEFVVRMMVSVVLLSAIVSLPTPAWSLGTTDVSKGEILFTANCAGCHAGGNNYVSEKRTLRTADIQQYRGSTDPVKITNFVQNGLPHKLLPMKVPMDNNDYSDVVAYVLDQALGEKW